MFGQFGFYFCLISLIYLHFLTFLTVSYQPQTDERTLLLMTITLQNLTVSYDRYPAVHHIIGTFQPQLATAIVGPNGAGKSSLLKAILGLLPIQSGQVDLGEISHADIAYLPQQAEIDRSLPLSVFDLVAMGLWHEIGIFQSLNTAQRERIMHALVQVGLVDFSGKSIAALSRGQFQRVLFARILVQNAQVIILDEPFNAIDSKTTEDLLALVQTWPAQGKTVLAVLHDFNQVRTGFSQTVLLANELIAWGATSQVLTPENLAIANQRAEHWTEQKELCSS